MWLYSCGGRGAREGEDRRREGLTMRWCACDGWGRGGEDVRRVSPCGGAGRGGMEGSVHAFGADEMTGGRRRRRREQRVSPCSVQMMSKEEEEGENR